MGITGRYDFKGIKKLGAKGLALALSSTPWGAWLVNTPFISTFTNLLLELIVNWLANEGLIILNIAAIQVSGEMDQKQFDDAMSEAFKIIEFPGAKLTPEQMKEIDDKVIEAFRKFAVFTK